MSITKYDGLLYGGDYCPEQWGEETWLQDIEAMKTYHVNVVTLNVHSWCLYQPEEGPYDFTKLDAVVKLITDNDINIIMATGTAALPNWLLAKYPDIMSVHINGVRNKPGKRVNFCPNSLNYLSEIKSMCEALAEHYKNQDNILLWHLSNELEGKCYCDICARAYRNWLKERYGTLEELNQKWNTMFWGHHYSNWNQINPPTYTNMVYQNVDGMGIDLSTFPTETIEYLRFMSYSFSHGFEEEKEAILKYIPDAIVTNNFQYNRNFDYDILTKTLDVVSFDSYPGQDEPTYMTAFNYDLSRGINKQDPFLIMEMTPNHASWARCAPVKRPGQVANIAIQAIARGAESSLFFQIRRSRSGYEKFHGAMIEHSGRTDTRLGKELIEYGKALKKMGNSFLGSKIPSKAAIIMDWDCGWGVEIPSSIHKNMNYQSEVMYYYEWLFSQNIMVDVVRAGWDLSSYDLVIAPMLYMVEQDESDNIHEFVKNGGTFITTYYSGIADKTDNIWLGGYPALFRDMLGLWIEETDALKEDQKNTIQMNTPWLDGTYKCGFMCDLIRLEDARILGIYQEDFYQGIPCITENSYGKGKAVYIGSKPEKALVDKLLEHYCEEKTIRSVLQTQEGIEAIVRINDNKKFLFVINHNKTRELVKLDKMYKNLLNDEVINSVELPVYGYTVLEEV